MLENSFQIIIIALLVYIGYLGNFYLPSYFKKKAENLAQSQDLQQLTNLVKEVEFKFEERTQNLKAKLDLTNQLQLGLHNEERSSLINLHNIILEYYSFLSDVTLGGIDFKNNEAVENHMLKKNISSDAFLLSKYKAMLFIDENYDNGIENIVIEIGEDFLEFSAKYLDFCEGLIKNNHNYNLPLDEMKEYYEIRRDLSSDFTESVHIMIHKAAPKINELTIAMRGYLKKRMTN